MLLLLQNTLMEPFRTSVSQYLGNMAQMNWHITLTLTEIWTHGDEDDMKDDVKMQAEIKVMLPISQETLWIAGNIQRPWNGVSHGTSRRNQSCQHLDFECQSSRTVRQ